MWKRGVRVPEHWRLIQIRHPPWKKSRHSIFIYDLCPLTLSDVQRRHRALSHFTICRHSVFPHISLMYCKSVQRHLHGPSGPNMSHAVKEEMNTQSKIHPLMCHTCYISYNWQGSEGVPCCGSCGTGRASQRPVGCQPSIRWRLGPNQTQYLPSSDPPVASVAGWDQAP